MGEEKMLQGPPMLTQDLGHLCCMLIAVSSGLAVVCLRLMFIAKLLFKLFGFTILHLGATITDGGKSERSSGVNIMMQMTVNGEY